MKKLLKYFGVLCVGVLCLFVAMATPAAIEQAKSRGTPYGYYDYSGCGSNYSGGYSGDYSGSYPGSYSGSYPGGYPGSYSGGYSGSYPGGYPGSYSGGYPGGYSGSYSYQRPTTYCVSWIPGRWVPVTVIVPGRWEYRRVWIPSSPTTLYRRVPGYWQPSTYYNGSPDLSVWRTPGNNWYATPYQQGQQGQFGGYFDSYGVWHSYSYPQGSTSVPEK